MPQLSVMHRVYLAGPDLFLPDWPERAAQATALCAEHGLEAVLPVPATMLIGPGVTEPSDAEAANKVFQSCLEAVRNADGVIANLTPFRGSEPDSGTVTECALAYAWGKPVIGYVKFTAPVDELLNVSAYQKGDFKIFFADPRTRGEYLRWAPLLMAAEKWHQEHSMR